MVVTQAHLSHVAVVINTFNEDILFFSHVPIGAPAFEESAFPTSHEGMNFGVSALPDGWGNCAIYMDVNVAAGKTTPAPQTETACITNRNFAPASVDGWVTDVKPLGLTYVECLTLQVFLSIPYCCHI